MFIYRKLHRVHCHYKAERIAVFNHAELEFKFIGRILVSICAQSFLLYIKFCTPAPRHCKAMHPVAPRHLQAHLVVLLLSILLEMLPSLCILTQFPHHPHRLWCGRGHQVLFVTRPTSLLEERR